MKKFSLMFFTITATLHPLLFARPLSTEDQSTIGRLRFETGASISQRSDQFGSPNSKFETVAFPFWLKLGLTNKLDIGLTFLHVTETLDRGAGNFTGTQSAQLSPELKYAFNENWGVKVIWHARQSEDSKESLPIAQGDDFEAVALYKTSTQWPVNFNVGYDKRGKYSTRYGVAGQKSYRIQPGDIWETKAAVEIPMKWNFSFINEWSYYYVSSLKENKMTISQTSGDALDALFGMGWSYAGWTLQGGISFGLLDESHTSFDVTRGAGDVTYTGLLSYKLRPQRPE